MVGYFLFIMIWFSTEHKCGSILLHLGLHKVEMTASTKGQLSVYYFIISDQENKGRLSIKKRLDHRILSYLNILLDKYL